MNKNNIFLLILVFLFGLLVSCDEPKNVDPPIDNPIDDNPVVEPIYYLNFKQSELTIKIGEEVELEIDTNLDEFLTVSSNEEVATLIKNNLIKGLTPGTTIVTATFQDLSCSIKVTVLSEKLKYEITEYEYWINLIKDKIDVNALLMDKDDIESFNNNLYDNSDIVDVYDLTKLAKYVSNNYVSENINKYTNINKYSIYHQDGTKISNEEKLSILANRNLENINNTVEVKFGIAVKFSPVRSYPTNFYSDTVDFDRFQEDAVDVSECVLIYHYSKDNKWVFARSERYIGWIEADNIALCTEDEFLEFYQNDHYMVVISENIETENVRLRMGDKLPIKEVKENSFFCAFPKRNDDGTLKIDDVEFNKDEKVNDGFLPYNYINLFKQGFKLLSTPYRWGDLAVDGRDCSSTMNAIFHCFGFVMPRNTSSQRKIPGYSTVESGMSETKMKNYAVGTMIFTSSHVMMYIGTDESGVCYLLHNSGGCHLESLASYGGSKIIATLTIQNHE